MHVWRIRSVDGALFAQDVRYNCLKMYQFDFFFQLFFF